MNTNIDPKIWSFKTPNSYLYEIVKTINHNPKYWIFDSSNWKLVINGTKIYHINPILTTIGIFALFGLKRKYDSNKNKQENINNHINLKNEWNKGYNSGYQNGKYEESKKHIKTN